MTLTNAIALIQNSLLPKQTAAVWADLGCGSGLFTYALANILPADSTIYAIDKSGGALQQQPNPGEVTIIKKQFDFITDELNLPVLDGILMANSLHYVKDKQAFIKKINGYIKPGGMLLLVEYDTNKSNTWVPYPLSFTALKVLFANTGFTAISKLGEQPSIFGTGNMYAASLIKSEPA